MSPVSRTSSRPHSISAAPVLAARHAKLKYVADTAPGITRRRWGKTFRYLDAKGRTVRDKPTLERIRALVIPPAWTQVWICISPHGHLQATGRDARGRKQYLYHERWRDVRDEAKYGRLAAFAEALPLIRRRVASHLALPGMPREKVLALIVKLLESTLIRIGNEEYAKTNGSFGLTTMKRRHVVVRKQDVRFSFRGKSGVQHTVEVHDVRVAKLVRQCQELPGQRLFTYQDEQGEVHAIDSADVNAYLRDVSGQDFTAKDFRTWYGTIIAIQQLLNAPPAETERERKAALVQAVKSTAARLGNTVSICRKCYIHPAAIGGYQQGTLLESFRVSLKGRRSRGWWEAAVLKFLLKANAPARQAPARKAG